MKSMTGFGRGTASDANYQVTVEISAVNSRKQLEIRVSAPRELGLLEPELRGIIQGRLSRGNLNVSVAYQHLDATGGACPLPIDVERASAVCRQLRTFATANGLDAPTLQDVLAIPGVLVSGEQTLPAIRPLVGKALETALDALDAMRTREGDSLRADLLARGNAMQETVSRIEKLEEGTPLALKERLMERIRALKVDIGPDDERLAKEVAFLVDRADITEEIVRLKSHLRQYARLMDETVDVGRNLDFLCQELNREANTLASKCAETAVNDEALSLKVELSKVREQIMNVE